MKQFLFTAMVYGAAALAEIAGCFAFWAWLKAGKFVWWVVPGIASLIAFAWLLTLAPTDHAGRAYAAYGGVYLAASVLWLWRIEGQVPDKWDFTGTALALAAALIIVFGPRGIGRG